MSCILMSDNSEQVAALIKELLSLNRSKSAPMAYPPSAEEVETTAVQTEESQARTGASPLFSRPLGFSRPPLSRNRT